MKCLPFVSLIDEYSLSQIFWHVVPYNLVHCYQHLRVTYCLHLLTLKTEAEGPSEMCIIVYQTVQRYIPRDSNLIVTGPRVLDLAFSSAVFTVHCLSGFLTEQC
jgi:hypothetical protein